MAKRLKFAQGLYEIKHPEKYIGKRQPKFRSGWESAFMRFLDNHPGIISWASEPIRIPYRNPLTGKNTNYVPDFLITYVNKKGETFTELIEIKPNNQTLMENARSQHNKAHVVQNHAKWQNAALFAKQHGIKFRVVTEQELFPQGDKKAANKIRKKYGKKKR